MRSTTPFLLLRESLRPVTTLNSSRIPLRAQWFSTRPHIVPAFSNPRSGKWDAPVCTQCRSRAQSRSYSLENDKRPEGIEGSNNDQTTQSPLRELASKGEKSKEGKGLPSQWESRRSDFFKKFGDVMDNLQGNIFVAGKHLNDLTGYSAIEKMKEEILTQENHVRQTRLKVRQAKEAYSAAINCRSTSQREVNELLQRKHAWTPADLERFTSLYRSDHANERAESETQEALAAAEREAEEAAAALSKNILSRYHEEQVWSDKIRRMSTWGTWGLMGVNVLLFLIFQIAVEPWRRKRLVKGFEEKVMEALEKENGKVALNQGQDASSTGVIGGDEGGNLLVTEALKEESSATKPMNAALPLVEEDQSISQDNVIASEPSDSLEGPLTSLLPADFTSSSKSWSQSTKELFTDRRVTLSQRDLSNVVLESVAAGAAFGTALMGLLIVVFRPR
ncbi:sensitivity to high expression protein she9 [Myotisia sp. PD_48]|nr:sensitivity to high expression protein she9 [Myotisia sp. PD_48]